MIAFIVVLVVLAAILAAASVPLLIVASGRRRTKTLRRFLVAAGAISIFGAVLTASSQRLIDQCEKAGNPSCFDSGGDGFRLMLVVVYTMVALTRAASIHLDNRAEDRRRHSNG